MRNFFRGMQPLTIILVAMTSLTATFAYLYPHIIDEPDHIKFSLTIATVILCFFIGVGIDKVIDKLMEKKDGLD